jgi:hypothetical protein
MLCMFLVRFRSLFLRLGLVLLVPVLLFLLLRFQMLFLLLPTDFLVTAERLLATVLLDP